MSAVDKYITKGREYYYTKFIRLASVSLALKLKNTKIIPEQIVILGLLAGLFSAFFYSRGTYPAVLFGSLLYVLAWFLDFVDGDLARITGKVSERGEWLDSLSGRFLEMAVYFGVCFGLARIYSPQKIWILGFTIVALHHIIVSIMSKETIMASKSQNAANIDEINTLDKKNKIGILKIILRELTAGLDINGFIIILGGLINKLMPALILCLIYNIAYLLLRLITGVRRYFLKTSV